MRVLGALLFVIGLISTIITGVMVFQQTESISIFGLDIVISQGNFLPMIISALVLILGFVMMRSRGLRAQY